MAKEGKKSKKLGRNARKPSHQRYNAESRWVKNKVKRIVKQLLKFPKYSPTLTSETADKVAIELKKRSR